MPRKKKSISLEIRLQKANELFLRKKQEKNNQLAQLRNTKIYKLTRKSCLVFIIISQLILVDWVLPYNQKVDKIKNKEINYGTPPTRERSMYITTQQNRKLQLLLEEENYYPQINDSVFILESILLFDAKKVKDLNDEHVYSVKGSLTNSMLPFIIIPFAISLLFFFIKDIEIKAFYYFVFIVIATAIFSLVYWVFRHLQI